MMPLRLMSIFAAFVDLTLLGKPLYVNASLSS
jgi:hypothetical protein